MIIFTACAGAAVGFVGILFGIGGGIIMMPFMLHFYFRGKGDRDFEKAKNVSLMVMLFSSTTGIITNIATGLLDPHFALYLGIGSAIGAVFGNLFSQKTKGRQMKFIFAGVFTAYILYYGLTRPWASLL